MIFLYFKYCLHVLQMLSDTAEENQHVIQIGHEELLWSCQYDRY